MQAALQWEVATTVVSFGTRLQALLQAPPRHSTGALHLQPLLSIMCLVQTTARPRGEICISVTPTHPRPLPREPSGKQAAPQRDGEHLKTHGRQGSEGGILANDRALILITGLFAFK